ncbi:metallophosphatase family protein [Polyangium aurulentum]|nr:metallophosphoesterase family protein [Polyangium aurulentum]UQA54585.1 metallophosphatase family protein [Polyangium aurulentum]
MPRPPALLVGVISDTHGLMRPEALAALAGSTHILHAGDIGGQEILDALAAIAPVTAVRGNNDRGPWAERLPDRTTVTLAGHRILVLHDRGELDLDPRALTNLSAVVTGHSHRPAIERRDGVLFLNPGSAGPRRFSLPITLARLLVADERLDAELVPLAIPPAPARRKKR